MSNEQIIESYKKYMLRRRSEKTTKEYVYWINMFLSYVQKSAYDITVFDIQNFTDYKLDSGSTPSSINIIIPAFNSFCEYCKTFNIHKDIIHYPQMNDNSKRERRSKKDTLPPAKFDEYVFTLEDYFRNHENFTNARKWVILHLLIYGMLRKSEASNLLESNIEKLPSKKYKIGFIGKGGAFEHVILPASFEEPYELYLSLKKKWKFKCPNLLCTFKDKPMYDTAYNNDLAWMNAFTGINLNISPHKLRTAGGNKLKEEGCHPEQIRKKMRHKSIKTTMDNYFKNYDDMKEEEEATDFFGR